VKVLQLITYIKNMKSLDYDVKEYKYVIMIGVRTTYANLR